MDSSLPYIGIVILICFSAFFSGSEIAYASVNRSRLKKAADGGNRAAAIALNIYDKYDDALVTILVGNNLVNIASSSLATVIALSLMGNSGAPIATAIITVLILIFGEIMPKILAKQKADIFTMFAAAPLRLLMWLTFPIVWIVVLFLRWFAKLWDHGEDDAGMTEEELSTIIETAQDEGVIDEEQGELLQSALDFSEIQAQEIITPRVNMEAIDIEDSRADAIELLLSTGHSRIPVYADTTDHIVGILHVNQVLMALAENPDVNLRKMIMPPCFIHKTMSLPAVLRELRSQKTHLAIVMDEYGGTLGLVTMEDLMEQLVGEIWDETDEIIEEFHRIDETKFEILGSMSLFEMFEELDISDKDPDSEYTTAGGWAIEMLNGTPHEGDSFEYENLTVTVEKMEDRSIEKLTVIKTPGNEEEEIF